MFTSVSQGDGLTPFAFRSLWNRTILPDAQVDSVERIRSY